MLRKSIPEPKPSVAAGAGAPAPAAAGAGAAAGAFSGTCRFAGPPSAGVGSRGSYRNRRVAPGSAASPPMRSVPAGSRQDAPTWARASTYSALDLWVLGGGVLMAGAACAAAVQNMQLTAHSLGLASIWRTGPVAYHEHMRRFFNLEEGDAIVAYLYLGYPDMGDRPRRRRPVTELTVWHEGHEPTP